MNYIAFDDQRWDDLRPLSFTRPVADLRVGILTIREKWGKHLGQSLSFKTQDYLQGKFKLRIEDNNTFINGGLLPTEDIIEKIKGLALGASLVKDGTLLACRLDKTSSENFDPRSHAFGSSTEYSEAILQVLNPWDIFRLNGEAINADFALLTKGRTSQPIDESNRVIAPENIFIEEGAVVQCAVLNASTGPIYIGKDAEVMENSAVRGPFALCEHSTLKLSAKIYGPTTIGPHSKVGGEVNNSVIQGFSNKGHDGFLGNSVLGEWCNLGADTNNSNLKNNYAEVKLWSYTKKRFIKTGLQFCGLIMGDHSKCGINTMFNTGTVVGVSANIFGSGFPRNFVPSFSWGGSGGYMTFTLPKAFEVAEKVMARRNLILTNEEKSILEYVFRETEDSRNF